MKKDLFSLERVNCISPA